MALTREFRETVLLRAQKDRAFRQAMLTEAVNEFLTGDLEAGKAMLRDYINATITFDRLAALLDKPSKSLQRMLGPNGNPTAENIFSLIKALQQTERVRLRVNAAKKAA
ncbi:MAG: transcriptional regulator [Candidatus Muproteobacteria bacterium RBG_16_62_13]|uniref:Transcriptional regulator n=1 Tax=Candidatus Muproteobacteria bacterium RBG_16_62_13 TaxID=1817756 RepID=A0A1F6T554_9PROT|nr:MAG: transcriptional regulator [Candidatus Muproteobacteria bacterium RBG_16_62_13]